MQHEKLIENLFLDYFSLIPGWYAVKVQSVGIWDEKKGLYRKAGGRYTRGVSDIIAIHAGRMVCIEVKTPERKKNLSVDQKAFRDNIVSHGGVFAVCTDLDELIEVVKKVERGICGKPVKVGEGPV